jgi:hypothetical protein
VVEESPSPSPAAEPLPRPARLGVAALALGLVSVLVLCLPVVGYVSPFLSGLGLLLGLAGLFGALTPSSSPASGADPVRRFGTRAWDYPLAGVAACLLALGLALLPLLLR